MKHAARGAVSLGTVLACVVGTMALGIALKSPCADGNWTEGKEYRLLCYTDLVPLLGTEQLVGGRLPYLDACKESEHNCDEYPVITMYVMRAAAWLGGENHVGFFFTNAILLTAAAAATAVSIWLLADRRALWFALSPTLLLYGVMNWDLIAVAFATMALVAFANRRDGWAGTLLGLGAASKFYPLFLLVPLFAQAIQDREPDRAVKLLWWSAGTWLALNVPFIIWGADGWIEFFDFSTTRAIDFDSIWSITCLDADNVCFEVTQVNLASAILFVSGVALVWFLKRRLHPDFSRWTLGLPIVAIFLLTSKVYSPQFSLWLLPWFALVLPEFRHFLAFQITEVAVFVTRFWWFGVDRGVDVPAVDRELFELAVAARWAVVAWCVVVWLKAKPMPLALGTRGWGAKPPLPAPP